MKSFINLSFIDFEDICIVYILSATCLKQLGRVRGNTGKDVECSSPVWNIPQVMYSVQPTMLSVPTHPQRMLYPLPYIQFSHPLRIITATAECCLLTSPQHSTQYHLWSWLEMKHSGLEYHTFHLDFGFLIQSWSQTDVSPLMLTLYTYVCGQYHQHQP